MTTDLQATVRPMRADARRNRARIMDAARELFASERSDVGIDDLARRAGVGVGTVYRHFPDKQALMGELVRERFVLFNERLQAAIADERAEPFAALCDALHANLASMSADAATRFAFMSGGERVFAHAAAEAEEFVELCRVLVSRAQQDGALRKDFRAEDIPMLMCGICATIDSHKPDWEWERYFALIRLGMRGEG
jgi:AcrR family transcriptional regulator